MTKEAEEVPLSRLQRQLVIQSSPLSYMVQLWSWWYGSWIYCAISAYHH